MIATYDAHPTAVVERHVRAMARGDLDAMFAELATDVICSFPTAPGDPQEIRGLDTNRAFFSSLIRPMFSTFALTRLAVHALADDPERVLAEFASDGSLVDGSPYRNQYLCLATVHNGKIQQWMEFSDPAPIERGFAVLRAAHAALDTGQQP